MNNARQHKCRIIVNRHVVKRNAKHGTDEPCLSIHAQGCVEYARSVELTGKWTLQQDFTGESPCNGARVWIEGVRENVEIVKE